MLVNRPIANPVYSIKMAIASCHRDLPDVSQAESLSARFAKDISISV